MHLEKNIYGRWRKTVKFMRAIVCIVMLLLGVWCLAAMIPVLKMPELAWQILAGAMLILFLGSFRSSSALAMLAVIELTFLIYFLSLTPEKQFAGVKFQRIFAVKPEIIRLPDGKFEVINMRQNRYPDDYEEYAPYQDVFVCEKFDPSEVVSMQLAQVYWGGRDYVAHTMLNFKFSNGKELALSIEPRTPIGVDRKNFTHLCRQHELIFILSDPQDIFYLRSHIRGENLYVYDLNFTPEETAVILKYIVDKAEKLYHDPEFYDLIKANCITAVYPAFQIVRPELKVGFRVLFNGYMDRMFFEQKLLKCRDGESFESLKSRSFVRGKSQGKLQNP